MVISGVTSLRKARFTEFLIRENALEDHDFNEWIFLPGMMFKAQDKWWGDQAKRDKPHEGLDLGLFRDRRKRIRLFKENTKIPAMYDGRVVAIFNDFLGKSVIIEHAFPNSDNIRFCTMFGHTKPHDGLRVGKNVEEGDIIATLTDPSKFKANIMPHLHLSIGWTTGYISYDKLDWQTIGASDTLSLFDPLYVMDWRYSVLERNFTFC